MNANRIKETVFYLAATAAMLALGLFIFVVGMPSGSDTVYCDAKPMEAMDSCVKDNGESYSYGEMKQRQEDGSPLLVVVGGVVFAAGLGSLGFIVYDGIMHANRPKTE